MKLVLAGIVVALVACSKGGGAGAEREACRPADGDKPRCQAGLTCMSDLCVRPPPADCASVAEALVSMELGNYAPREDRAAAVPAKKALCERLKISAAEGECLAKATDTWSAASCVPRLYPEVEAGGCDEVVAKLTAMLSGQMGGDPTAQQMMNKVTTVIRQSCAEDGWPDALRACIIAMPANDLSAFSKCEKVTPPALKEKMERRMKAALSM